LSLEFRKDITSKLNSNYNPLSSGWDIALALFTTIVCAISRPRMNVWLQSRLYFCLIIVSIATTGFGSYTMAAMKSHYVGDAQHSKSICKFQQGNFEITGRKKVISYHALKRTSCGL
jgi:hypothetical protein